jgi:hypothetical protein
VLLFPLHGYVDFVSAEHRKGISPALSDRYTPRAYAGYGRCTPEGIHGGGVVVIRRGTYTAGEEGGGGRRTSGDVHWWGEGVVAVRCGAYTVCRTCFAWGSQASRALSSGLASLLVTEHHEGTKPALWGCRCTLRRVHCMSHALCLGLVGLTRAVEWVGFAFGHRAPRGYEAGSLGVSLYAAARTLGRTRFA